MSDGFSKLIAEVIRKKSKAREEKMDNELTRIKALPFREQRKYRRKLVSITKEFIADILKPSREIIYTLEGMPEDAEITEVSYDVALGSFQLIITSDEFDLIPEGYSIPPRLSILIGKGDVT